MLSYSLRLSLLVVFSILFNLYIEAQNPSDLMEAFPDVRYQPYSSSSLINQSSIQTKLQCAELCLQYSFCRTATFMQPNRSCSLYTEFPELGTLIPANKTFTFRREVPYTCSNMTYLQSTNYPFSDITMLYSMNKTQCVRVCMLTANCKGAAYNTNRECWPKKQVNFNQSRNDSDVEFLLC